MVSNENIISTTEQNSTPCVGTLPWHRLVAAIHALRLTMMASNVRQGLFDRLKISLVWMLLIVNDRRFDPLRQVHAVKTLKLVYTQTANQFGIKWKAITDVFGIEMPKVRGGCGDVR